MGERKLSPEESRALFEQRETWCAVDKMKEEDFCRVKRKHYKHHMESHIFEDMTPVAEPRCTFDVKGPKHFHRRHFPANHLISKWTVM
ncbi:hypothetical protein ACOMHN_064454 [Nucella lapillus]